MHSTWTSSDSKVAEGSIRLGILKVRLPVATRETTSVAEGSIRLGILKVPQSVAAYSSMNQVAEGSIRLGILKGHAASMR